MKGKTFGIGDFVVHDSTKANFDELEKRIATNCRKNEECHIDFRRRLTALESKISDHVNNIWHGPYKDAELDKRLTALEAKVDAPKASFNTWNVVSWKQCPKCGTWYCRSHNCDPNTCGNCAKAARWDNPGSLFVACSMCSESGEPRLYLKTDKACPHYDRRRA